MIRSEKMDYISFNPVIRSVSLYEKVNKTDECVAYDSRVIYMISGDLTATVGGEKLGHAGPGQLIYIPAGTPYKLKSKYLRAVVVTFDFTSDDYGTLERIPPVPVSEFDSSRCHKGGIDAPFDKHLFIEDMESERDTFIKMSDIFTSAEGTYRARVSAMFKLIMLKIYETVDEHALPARMVEEFDGYIRENCSDEISNTEIGAIFGYHPFYVSRVLKEKKGITLRQYIIAYRLKRSKKMLELTKLSIAEIAEECGFTDASYFTKTFRQSFGVTPKEWRNKFKEDFI